MKLFITYCTLVALSFSSAQSQSKEKLFEFDRLGGKPDRVHAHSNLKGDMTFLIKDDSDIHLVRFDSQFSKLGRQQFKNPSIEYPQIIAGTAYQDTVSFYFIDSETKKKVTTYFFKSWDFNLKEGSTPRFKHTLLESAKVIASYVWKDQLYVLTLPKDKEQKKLRAHIFQGPKLMDSWELDIASDEFHEKLKSEQFQQIKDNEFIPFRSVISSYKFFQKESKIWITADNGNSSFIGELDLLDRTIAIKEFKTKPFEQYAPKAGINSFLLADKLFQWYVSSKQGRISIYDLGSGNLINEISLNSEEEVATKNGPMIQTDWPEKTKTVLRTKTYFKRVAKNEPVITVNLDKNNNYTLEIGAVHNYVYNNFYNPWMHHWMHQMHLPPTNIPVPSFPGPNNSVEEQLVAFLEGNVVKTFSFPMVLDGKGLAFQPGGISISKYFNAQDTMEDITKAMKRYTSYKYLDHHHICAYNQKTKKFEVFEVKAP